MTHIGSNFSKLDGTPIDFESRGCSVSRIQNGLTSHSPDTNGRLSGSQLAVVSSLSIC